MSSKPPQIIHLQGAIKAITDLSTISQSVVITLAQEDISFRDGIPEICTLLYKLSHTDHEDSELHNATYESIGKTSFGKTFMPQIPTTASVWIDQWDIAARLLYTQRFENLQWEDIHNEATERVMLQLIRAVLVKANIFETDGTPVEGQVNLFKTALQSQLNKPGYFKRIASNQIDAKNIIMTLATTNLTGLQYVYNKPISSAQVADRQELEHRKEATYLEYTTLGEQLTMGQAPDDTKQIKFSTQNTASAHRQASIAQVLGTWRKTNTANSADDPVEAKPTLIHPTDPTLMPSIMKGFQKASSAEFSAAWRYHSETANIRDVLNRSGLKPKYVNCNLSMTSITLNFKCFYDLTNVFESIIRGKYGFNIKTSPFQQPPKKPPQKNATKVEEAKKIEPPRNPPPALEKPKPAKGKHKRGKGKKDDN